MDKTPNENLEFNSTAAEPPPMQFGLKTLFVLTAMIAFTLCCFQILGATGFWVALYVFGTMIWLSTRWKRSIPVWASLLETAAFVLATGVVIVLVLSADPFAPRRVPAWQSQCQNNLRNIGIAILQHSLARDYLPAVYTTDAAGRPLMSWRTKILPYLGRQNVFSSYRGNELWNSKNNLPLCQPQPLFQCPSDSIGQKTNNYTSYVAIVGPGTAWQPGKRISLTDFKDGQSDTILLVEMKNSGIAWSEPRDLDLTSLPPGLTPQNLLDNLSNHRGGFEALFADGRVEFIPSTIPWSQFIALTTIAGGETINRNTW